MRKHPHHTDVPFQQEERYKENIKACITYQVAQQAEFAGEDPDRAEHEWLATYGPTLDRLVDEWAIRKKLKFDVARVRAEVERVCQPEVDEEEWVEAVGFGD